MAVPGDIRAQLRSLRSILLGFLRQGKVQDDQAKCKQQQHLRYAHEGAQLKPLTVAVQWRVRVDWDAVQGPQPNGQSKQCE